MSDSTNPTVEAYKSVIDFNKTAIGISSGVLTFVIAYIVHERIELSILNFVSLGLIVASIILSLIGFGQSIATIKDSKSRPVAITSTNVSVYMLIIGIALLLTFKGEEITIHEILSDVAKIKTEFTPDNLKSMEFKNDCYVITYSADSTTKQVVYSLKEHRVVSIK